MIGFNAAAMLKALELCVQDMCRYCRAEARACDLPQCLDGCETSKMAKAALAKPPRNCDIYGWRDAWKKWRAENHPKNPLTYNEAYESTAAFMDWYMGTADKGGAA